MSESDKQTIAELSKKLDAINGNLEDLKRATEKPSKVNLSLVGMPLDEMAILHFRLFLSSLPLAATLVLAAFGLSYLLGWV